MLKTTISPSCKYWVTPASIMVLLFAMLAANFVQADAVDFETQTVTIALAQEPPNLNSLRMTDLVSFFVIGHVNEGLVRYDKRGRLGPGVAESWEVTSTKITFKLRENAKWSDGSLVTAHDFVFAWRTLSDPLTAASYAAIMHPVKNAEKVQNGELPVTALGVNALDDFTLEVLLESSCGYCVGLMTHASFFPIKESFYNQRGDKYGAEVGDLLYNGPFQLKEWTHGATMSIRKNFEYWNAAVVHLNEIKVGYITSDNRTRLNLFRDGSIALARLGAETVRDASNQGLRLRTFVSGGMAYIRFNVNDDRTTANKKIRKAIQLVFDTNVFVNKVIGIPGYKPAHSFFPSWLNGVEDKFLVEYPPRVVDPDMAKARQLLTEAKKELGVESLPAISMLTVASPTGTKIAEYFQGLLGQSLGLEVKVDQQTLKQYLEKSKNRQFDIAISSWYPDFDDVVTYADLLVTWNPNNRGDYVNADYDQRFRVLQRSLDPIERMDAAAELQKIIIDDVPLIPMAETGSAYLQHSKLKGVIRRVIGQDPDYTFARVVK
jgi:oligopeptide transport system substrate-binding protein